MSQVRILYSLPNLGRSQARSAEERGTQVYNLPIKPAASGFFILIGSQMRTSSQRELRPQVRQKCHYGIFERQLRRGRGQEPETILYSLPFWGARSPRGRGAGAPKYNLPNLVTWVARRHVVPRLARIAPQTRECRGARNPARNPSL